jgi:Domain of unknown function (DUF4363)
MKNTTISIILFIILVFGLVFLNHKFTELCDNLIDKSNVIENLIEKDELNLAYYEASELLNYLKDNDAIPAIYLNQVDYQQLVNEALKLCIYIKRDDISEASASLDLIEFLSEHLKEIQEISIKNLL